MDENESKAHDVVSFSDISQNVNDLVMTPDSSNEHCAVTGTQQRKHDGMLSKLEATQQKLARQTRLLVILAVTLAVVVVAAVAAVAWLVCLQTSTFFGSKSVFTTCLLIPTVFNMLSLSH